VKEEAFTLQRVPLDIKAEDISVLVDQLNAMGKELNSL
jgi:hypothetical protein